MSKRLRRARDGAAEPIPPSEFEAWTRLTATVVHPHEYAILGAMDAAYCDELGKELGDYHQRLKDSAATADAPRKPAKGRRK